MSNPSDSASSKTDDYRKHALVAYKGNYKKIGASRINAYLRNFIISDSGIELQNTTHPIVKRICAIIRQIDSILVPAAAEYTVYRGLDADHVKQLRADGVTVNKSFTSVSTDINVAKTAGKTILAFTIPLGMKIHNYSTSSHKDYEREILIERNTQFVGCRTEQLKDGYTLIHTTIAKWSLPKKKDVGQEFANSNQNALDAMRNKLEDLDAADGLSWS